MKNSLLFRLLLLLLPIVAGLNIAILVFAYQTTYDAIYDANLQTVENAASFAAEYFEMYDPYNLDDCSQCSEEFNHICKQMGLAYLCAVKPDIENNRIEYLAIGFGEGASEEAQKTRYPGVVVDVLHPEHIQAFQGEMSIRNESNQFGDTIICYMPVERYYDSHTYRFVNKTVSVVAAEIFLPDIVNKIQSQYTVTVLYTLGITVLILVALSLLFYFRVSKPAGEISRRMTSFVSDRENGFEPLAVKGNDEFARVSLAFNTMAGDIDRYLSELSALTLEKQTRQAELDIANNIQQGLLPKNRYRGNDAVINAAMLPARNVGGDLYDYQTLPDGRLCVAIADVSGKGVSAALFMSRAITLLHQYAAIGYSPSRILYEYNNILSSNNPGGMFITTFVGIYDPQTHTLVYSNGGHNPPYLLSDRLTMLDGAMGMAAGIFPNVSYEEASVTLRDGDTLFLYTDGVNEAESVEHTFFGTDALERVLADALGSSGERVRDAVLDAVAAFAEGAEQSDDITVLVMQATAPLHIELQLSAQVENLPLLTDAIAALTEPSDEVKDSLTLMVEEIFVNICSYAYDGKVGEVTVCIDVTDRVTMTFTDHGRPFDPTREVLNIGDYDVEHAIGGLGRFLTFEVADAYRYTYADGCNILTLEKLLP